MERKSTFSRCIERGRSSLLVCGFLLALLVLGGPLQSISLRPPDMQAQEVTLCDDENPNPENIVHDCDLRLDGFVDLEFQALDSILALHQLPGSDRSRILAWERDEVRAVMFENLITLIKKDPADRTPTEQSIIDAMAEIVTQRRIDAAQYSLDQYVAWHNNPCDYQAPHGFTYERDNAWCEILQVQQMRGPIPPTLEDFLNYGFAEIYQDFKEGGAAELISGETARLLGVIGGFVAVGIAAAVGAGIGASLSVTSAIITAIHPFLAAAVARAAGQAAISSVAGAAAAGTGALSIGAVATIVVLAVVIIVIQAITVIAQEEIPVQLQEGLDQAQAGVDLQQLAQSEGGMAEIYAAFILTTLPDFPNEGAVPAAQATDRTFVITDPQGSRTHSHTINYQCWNATRCQGADLDHTARVHEGWFVDTSDATSAERMTLEIDYIDWNGEGWTASRIGPQEFLHTRTGDDSEDFVSEEIKYLDPNGVELTAVLNHPPTTPAAPVPDDTVNNGTFQLDWPPAATDADGDPVTYTLLSCDESLIVIGDSCAETAVATDLTTTSYTFTDSAPESAGLFKYRVQASDGRLQGDKSAWSENVLVDQQPPEVTFASRTPAANADGWNNTDVIVEWTCSDTEPNILDEPSGVVSETVSETVTTEGANQSAIGVCEDNAGNTASATVDGISIDKTAPIAQFDGPYVVNEGSSIQLSSELSTDAPAGIASAAFALDGDDQFDDGNPATFDGIDGPSVHPVKLRLEDRAGNVTMAETVVTVNNVAPTIDGIATNGPVPQGQPVTVAVTASDVGGVNDPLSYAFDCDEDGLFEVGPQPDNASSCALDPAAATTTIGVQVSDDDQGVTTGTVEVGQTVTLCGNIWNGGISQPGPGGSCATGSISLVLPDASPTMLCIDRYTGGLSWTTNGSCASGRIPHTVPGSGPLPYCASVWTGMVKANPAAGPCSNGEVPGVIPGTGGASGGQPPRR